MDGRFPFSAILPQIIRYDSTSKKIANSFWQFGHPLISLPPVFRDGISERRVSASRPTSACSLSEDQFQAELKLA